MIACLAAAQESSAGLVDYMEAAVRNNPRTAIARAQTDLARADVVAAQAALLPTIRGTASWRYNQFEAVAILPDPLGGPPEEIVIVPRSQLGATLQARVPLLDAPALARWAGVRQGVGASEADERAVAQDLRLDVARAWYTAVAADDVVAAAERSRGAAEESVRTLSLRAEAGAATGLSVQRAQLELANTEQLVIDAKRAASLARRALATLSGLPEPTVLPNQAANVAPVAPEAEIQAAATANRPELAAAQRRVDQLQLARKGALLGYTPTVAATASEQLTNATGFAGEAASWVIGAETDWLLVSFGERNAAVRRARASLTSAEATLQQLQATVRDEVHAAHLELASAEAKVTAARTGASVGVAAANEVRLRFQAGTASQAEVIQAERDALDAEVQRIRAEGELAIARLAIQRAAGVVLSP